MLATRFNSPSTIPTPFWDDVTRQIKKHTFALASYLTEPVCNFDADRLYLEEKVFTQLFPCDGSLESRIANCIRKAVIGVDMAINLCLTPFTAPLGILLRFLGANLSQEPFLYETTDVPPKDFPEDRQFNWVNWNVLLIPGKNSLLHGGAPHANSAFRPAKDGKPAQGLPYLGLEWLCRLLFVSEQECITRLDALIAEIRESDADVICLYEGFDFSAVEKIKTHVKDQFHCMISNIAPRSVGTNSGVVILSKFEIPVDSLLVQPFPKEYTGPDGKTFSLGDAGFCEKSFVQFSIRGLHSENQPTFLADISPEHLNHSNYPAPQYITTQEEVVRTQQLDFVFTAMNKKRPDQRAVLLGGDLNLHPTELKKHPFLQSKENDPLGSISLIGDMGGNPTWGGDKTSILIEEAGEERISGPQQLDYAFARSDTVESLTTTVENRGNYDPTVIKWDCLSDHYRVKTVVKLKV